MKYKILKLIILTLHNKGYDTDDCYESTCLSRGGILRRMNRHETIIEKIKFSATPII